MNQQLDKEIAQIQQALLDGLGDQLIALYQCNDLTSESNLLAILQEKTSIHEIRNALRPLHQQNNHISLPLITSPSTLARHLQLDFYFAHKFSQTGRLLTGSPYDFQARPMTAVEQISHLANAALQASAALAPQLLNTDEAQTTRKFLFQLAQKLDITINPASPVQTLAAIQAYLAHRLSKQPQLYWQETAPADPPSLLGSLLAIYELRDQVIFLLPDWPANRIKNYITQVDWTAVSQSLIGQYKGLKISTPAQYRLVIQHYQPADHYFHNYTHAWGQDPLTDLQIPHHQVIQELARFPSQMEVETFPHAYIRAEDDQLDRLIHDYQNKLLNIQLREELLSRFDRRPRVTPSSSLPDRTAPNSQRIDAIQHHFNWWATHYATMMRQEVNYS